MNTAQHDHISIYEDEYEDSNSQFLEETELVRDKIKAIFNKDGRSGQIEAVRHLVFDKKDLILIAKTGYGKSLIFQTVPLIRNPPGISLIIMPLTLLQEAQAERLNELQGISAFVLNGESNTQPNRKAISEGAYTHG